MKKLSKIVAIIATTVMVLGSSLTAFAATSTATVSATATELSAVSATLADGTSVTVAPVSETVATQAQQATVALLGNSAGSLQVEKIFDLSATITGPTNITIAVPGVTAGQKVAVLHQKHDGTWEVVPVVGVSAGSVTATFTSLSPVAIITYASPKTGEAFPVAGIVCLVAFAGVAFCAKRRFAL